MGWTSLVYRVDVTLYLFLLVRCVIDRVRLAGQIGGYGIKRVPAHDTPYTHVTDFGMLTERTRSTTKPGPAAQM
jgi:hypothetical protein